MNDIDDRERGSAGQAQGGGMREGWQIRKLGDVCSLLNRGVSPAYLDKGGVCVLNQKCIRNHEVSYEPARRHDDAAKKFTEERFIQRGDVLVNSTGTGTLGRVAQVRNEPEEDTTVDSHVTIVRAKPGLFHLEFFGYMLVVIEEAIKEAGDGCGGQTELARSVLAERFSVSYPESLVEQQRIVALLDEAFAGLTTAKANAEQNLQNARALFESHLQFVFSQRGEGWEEKALGDVCSIARGGSPRPISEFITTEPGGINWIKISDATSSGKYIFKTAQAIKPEGVSRSRMVNDGDFLLSNSMSFGRPYIMRTSGCIHDGWLVLTDYAGSLTQDYLYYLLGSKLVFRQFDSLAAGSTVRKLNIELASRVILPVPPLEVQQIIAKDIEVLAEETQHLTRLYERKLADLEELKKSLLHQAFNGEL